MAETFVSRARRLVAENEGKHRYCTMDPGPHEALRMLGPLLDAVEAAKRAGTALDEMVTTQEQWELAVQKVIHTSPNVFPRAIDTGRTALANLRDALARLEVTNG